MDVVDADADAGHVKAFAASRVAADADADAGHVPHRGLPPTKMRR